jgi:hypothetical protein
VNQQNSLLPELEVNNLPPVSIKPINTDNIDIPINVQTAIPVALNEITLA